VFLIRDIGKISAGIDFDSLLLGHSAEDIDLNGDLVLDISL
jgi:hypothetical protein